MATRAAPTGETHSRHASVRPKHGVAQSPVSYQLVAVPPSATRLRPRIQTVGIHQRKRNENSFLEETRSNPLGLVQAQQESDDDDDDDVPRWYGSTMHARRKGTLADFHISSGPEQSS
jgi:hypothetical protein